MSGRDLESFMADADAFAALPDNDKARLFAGEALQGDTETAKAVEESSVTPAAAAEPEAKEGNEPGEEPVVLAKDGKNTIPFSVLEAERERARQLEQQLESLKSAKTEPPASEEGKPAAAADPDLSELVAQRNEALFTGDADKATAIDLQIIELQQKKANEVALAALSQAEAAKQEKDTQESLIAEAMAKATAAVEQYPFLNPESPSANQDAIDLVVAQRDRLMATGLPFGDAIAQAVAKVAPLFAVPDTTKPQESAQAKAREAIAKAQAQVPTSLSQVPAGATPHHDEGEAIRSMSATNLMSKFAGKSPDEIMALMNRVI